MDKTKTIGIVTVLPTSVCNRDLRLSTHSLINEIFDIKTVGQLKF